MPAAKPAYGGYGGSSGGEAAHSYVAGAKPAGGGTQSASNTGVPYVASGTAAPALTYGGQVWHQHPHRKRRSADIAAKNIAA